MIVDTPWTDPKRIARLSRELFGAKLAEQVATKLHADEGREGIWNRHRDWCGHGLLFMDGEFRLVEVSDGIPHDGPVLKGWSKKDEFVAWLARQSDFSCSGADEFSPEFKAKSNFSLNNQRLTRARLSAYVATEHALPVFQRFLDAALAEFAFLPQDYEFQLDEAEQNGREFVVGYSKNGCGISIQYEPFSSILITVSWRKDDNWIWTNKVLNQLAKERLPDWQNPQIDFEDTFPNFRGYLKAYAFLLQGHFQDFLRTGMPEWEQPLTVASNGAVAEIETTERSATDKESPDPRAKRRQTQRRISPRSWGVIIMIVSFVAMVFELRWFVVTGSPEPTGSIRSNYGILLMVAIPWIAYAVGALQVFSNHGIRDYMHTFAGFPTAKKIVVSVLLVVVLMLTTAFAVVMVSSN